MAKAPLISTLIGSLLVLTCSAHADRVQITLTGSVEAGRITRGPFINVRANDHAVAKFEVDSNRFADSVLYPARGYIIDPTSFTITIGSATTGMPASLGSTVPYFVLRDNDPAVDGFVISNTVDYVGSIPLNAGTGITMGMTFLRTFSTSTAFPSRNILDIAHRSFGFEDMSSYDWTIGVAGGGSLLVTYETISIENLTTPPFCAADYNQDGGVDGGDIEGFFRDWQDSAGHSDVNQDGGVDGGDIEAFFRIWSAGGC
ncbi:MAG: hypothetical protein NTV94_05095 [Planctomycetota bacterium]|nr:hypothetical protein [Planctomycetota bacterium]